MFRKELVTLARQRRYYVLRVVVGVGLLVGLWASFPRQPIRATTASLSEVGQAVLGGWTLASGVGLFLLVPMLVAGLVAGERDAKTFDVLLTTCLDDREIIVGKLTGRLLLICVTVAGSLPVLAIASWFGGFESGDVARAALLLTTIAAFAAALGVYYSTVTTKPYVALIRTYVVLVVVWYAIPHGLPMATATILGPGLREALALLSPATILTRGEIEDALLGIVTAAGYLLLAAWLLRRSCRRLRLPAERLTSPLVLRILRTVFQSAVAVITAFVERRSHWHGFRQFWRLELVSRYWGDVERRLGERFNPLLLRCAANVFDPQGYVAALQALAWIVFLAVMLTVGWFVDPSAITDREVNTFVLNAELVVLFLLAMVLAVSSFVRERQSGALDMLLLSHLSAAQFIAGAFWGVLRTLWPTVLLLLVSVSLVGYTQSLALEKAVWLLFVLLLLSYLVLAWLAVSLVCGRIVEAVGYGLLAAVVVLGFPIMYSAGNWLVTAANPLGLGRYVEPAIHALVLMVGIAVVLVPPAKRWPRLQMLIAIALVPTVVSAVVVVDRPVWLGVLLAGLALAAGVRTWSDNEAWTLRDGRVFGISLAALVAWQVAEQSLMRQLVAAFRVFPEAAWPYFSYLSWVRAISYAGAGGWQTIAFYAPLRELALSSLLGALLLVWQFDRLVGRVKERNQPSTTIDRRL